MFDWLFGSRNHEAPAQRPLLRADRPAGAIPLRVLMIVHDPLLEVYGGRRLHEHFGWHDPNTLAAQYCADLAACSGGAADYTIVKRHVVDGYPRKIDGFRYDDVRYLECWQRRGGFHKPDEADYQHLLDEFDVIEQVVRSEIDEVWLFGFPYAGYYESRMIGERAVWCNAPPLAPNRSCPRRFVVMGFNYERDVGCMLENFGHRVESIMSHVYRHHQGERNLWERFTRYDQAAPGLAACGNVHFAPSSRRDYDWGNQRVVRSNADAWYNFPDLSAAPRPVSAAEWGNGDMRAHHLWWLDHLPRVSGSSDGVRNNWWEYVLRPDRYLD